MGLTPILMKEFEETKGVIIILKSKDRQHNGQKDKMTNNDLQSIYSRLPWMSSQNGRRHLRKFVSNFLLLIKSVLFTFD